MFIVLAVAASFISCSEEKQQKVDQQYLDSQEYSDFKQNTDRELNEDDSEKLADDLVKISDCDTGYNLEPPF